MRNTLKVAGRGWIDPQQTTGGELHLTASDPWTAFQRVLSLADDHKRYVANGGMVGG